MRQGSDPAPPYDTRHTYASVLLSNGESLKYVSTLLGHSSIRMTADVYGHLEVGSTAPPSIDCHT